ncbi:MAG: hypothetical protein V4694_00130 [Pseudomonadota bacterium]
MSKILQTLSVTSLLFLTALFLKPVFADEVKKSFYVAKEESGIDGEKHQLCQEVSKILNESDNAELEKTGFTGEEFFIPKKYRNFSQFDWEDVPGEDLEQYIKSPKWLKKIKEYEKKYSSKIIIQKTTTDFDGDENEEDILRFRFTNQKISAWSCYINDNAPGKMLESYNKNLSFNNCFLFKYKDVPFQFEKVDIGSAVIKEPATPAGAIFIMRPICMINLTPLKIKSVKKRKEQEERIIL